MCLFAGGAGGAEARGFALVVETQRRWRTGQRIFNAGVGRDIRGSGDLLPPSQLPLPSEIRWRRNAWESGAWRTSAPIPTFPASRHSLLAFTGARTSGPQAA